MKATEIYGSKYLAASDIVGKTPRVQIRLVTRDNMSIDQKKEDFKLVLHFVGCKKSFALNRTNAMLVVTALGNETDAWPGAYVTLGTAKKEYRGALVDGLVILKIEPCTAPASDTPSVNGSTNGPTTF